MSEIKKIEKILDVHERRISKLEKLLIGKKSKELRTNVAEPSIMELIIEVKNEGFFDKPRFREDIVQKFEELGHIYETRSIDSPLLRALKKRILGRKKIGEKWGYVKR